MEEKFQKLLSTSLDEMLNLLTFAKGEIPILAQEILRYNMIMSLIWVMVSVLLIVALVIGLKRSTEINEDAIDVAWLICALIGTLALLIFACNIGDLIQTIVAPRMFLIEYIKDLLAHG